MARYTAPPRVEAVPTMAGLYSRLRPTEPRLFCTVFVSNPPVVTVQDRTAWSLGRTAIFMEQPSVAVMILQVRYLRFLQPGILQLCICSVRNRRGAIRTPLIPMPA